MNDEESPTSREERLPSAPDGYIRRETIFQTIGAAIGILGAVFGLVGLNNSYRDYVDRIFLNERTERIANDNQIENRLDGCCSLRRGR